MTARSEHYIVKPVLGAMRVLEVLSRSSKPLGLAELSAKATVTKTTTYRYLRTLEALGYAERTPTGEYCVGPSVFNLHTDDVRERALRAVCEPLMRRLSEDLRETVNLGVPKGRRIHYIAMLENRGQLRLRAEVGDSDCFHSTALGKAMLAYMPVDQLPNHLNTPMARFTPKTITSRRLLDADLSWTRRFGYAVDREENELGCTCYAAPIFDAEHVPIAAMSVSVPTARLKERDDLKIPEAVLLAAKKVTEQFMAVRINAAQLADVTSGRGRWRGQKS